MAVVWMPLACNSVARAGDVLGEVAACGSGCGDSVGVRGVPVTCVKGWCARAGGSGSDPDDETDGAHASGAPVPAAT